MKKETTSRILIIKDYLEKWDWNMAPLFMLAEEDAQALLEVLNSFEDRINRRAEYYRSRKKEAIDGNVD